MTAKDIHRLEVFQLKCLRCIRGVTLMDEISSDNMRDWSEMPKIADLLKYRRLRWLGHIARMKEDRLPKQLLFGTIEGVGRRGRPVKSWNECVRDDLDSMGLSCHWWRKCQDRAGWKGIIEKLLQRT